MEKRFEVSNLPKEVSVWTTSTSVQTRISSTRQDEVAYWTALNGSSGTLPHATPPNNG